MKFFFFFSSTSTNICFVLFLLCGLWLGSCRNKPDSFLQEEQTDYFPLAIGQQRIYEVDSVVFDLNNLPPIDSVHFFWKEEVVDTFRDAGGMLWYRIDRYRRMEDTLPWVFSRVVAASVQSGRAFWQEDNLRFIKLVFPFDEFTYWDGNAYISQGTQITIGGETIRAFEDWSYRVVALVEADTIMGQRYEQLVQVEEAAIENLINLRLAESHYARGKGLVYRAWSILDTQVLNDTLPWEEKAERGFVLRQWLIDSNF